MLKDVADFLTPVLQSSHFSTQGVLTPDEFVSSGEQLVHSCRTWQWEGGKAGTQKAYLPPQKQFLITRNVPCMSRANAYYTQQVPHSISCQERGALHLPLRPPSSLLPLCVPPMRWV